MNTLGATRPGPRPAGEPAAPRPAGPEAPAGDAFGAVLVALGGARPPGEAGTPEAGPGAGREEPPGEKADPLALLTLAAAPGFSLPSPPGMAAAAPFPETPSLETLSLEALVARTLPAPPAPATEASRRAAPVLAGPAPTETPLVPGEGRMSVTVLRRETHFAPVLPSGLPGPLAPSGGGDAGRIGSPIEPDGGSASASNPAVQAMPEAARRDGLDPSPPSPAPTAGAVGRPDGSSEAASTLAPVPVPGPTPDPAGPRFPSAPAVPLRNAAEAPSTAAPAAEAGAGDSAQPAFGLALPAGAVPPGAGAPGRSGAPSPKPGGFPRSAGEPGGVVLPDGVAAAPAGPTPAGILVAGSRPAGPRPAAPVPAGPERPAVAARPVAPAAASVEAGFDVGRSETPGSEPAREASVPGIAEPVLPPAGVPGAPSAPARQIAEAVLAELPRGPIGADPAPAGAQGPLKLLTLQLHPADLGTVLVRMRLRDGQLELSLQTAQAETARLLREDGQMLNDLLRQGGYRSEGVTVAVAAEPRTPPGNPGPQQGGAAQGFPGQGDSGANQGRPTPDQAGRRPPEGPPANAPDIRERTHDSVSSSPDRSGVYL